MTVRRILPASDRALLVEYDGLDEMLVHFPALQTASLAGVEELVPAAQTVLVRFDPSLIDARTLAAAIRAVPDGERGGRSEDEAVVDVLYDGADLAEVAGLLGVSTDELVRRHTEATWEVAFTGFAPGFAYCVGDDPLFQVPRRSSPRTRIPAGSVGLAAEFSGVYPRESPGGWQLIGRTSTAMWDLERERPAFLAPGQRVRYRAVRESISATPSEDAAQPTSPRTPDAPEATSTRAFEVVRPGPQLLLQDLGRPGLLGLGVPASGTADRRALRAANRIVGNPSDTACLELAGGGAELRATGRAVVAVTGASGARELIDAAGESHPLERGVPTAVETGDRIVLGGFTRGLRGYLAVRGGFAVADVLGSRSTDTLAGVGPAPLAAGDVLPLGDDDTGRAVGENDLVRPELPAAGETVTLDLVLGPRTDWFAEDSVRAFLETEWEVSPRSNRIGVRLESDRPLERVVDAELPSEGAVTGAVQVPADGQPVIFLADHPLTGGYPIIGAIADRDLDLAGQLPPGVRVRFRALSDFTEF